MALSPEDKKDVKGAFGKAIANKVSKVTKDSSYSRMNSERKRQGYAPKKDRASKGLYDFLDKYEK